LWLAAGTPDDEAAAAWQLAAYLASGPVNAEWAAATGYVPLSASAGDTGVLRRAWADRPALREPFDVLAAHGDDPEDLGPLAGPLADLHETLAFAVSRVVDEGADPDEALAEAADDGDRLLRAYNTGAPADPESGSASGG
jgi:ABC-type glycerol-3-phosphate transport system substrate-binding protein